MASSAMPDVPLQYQVSHLELHVGTREKHGQEYAPEPNSRAVPDSFLNSLAAEPPEPAACGTMAGAMSVSWAEGARGWGAIGGRTK